MAEKTITKLSNKVLHLSIYALSQFDENTTNVNILNIIICNIFIIFSKHLCT